MELETCPSCSSNRILTLAGSLLGSNASTAYCECEQCGDYSLSFAEENKLEKAQEEWNKRARAIKAERL